MDVEEIIGLSITVIIVVGGLMYIWLRDIKKGQVFWTKLGKEFSFEITVPTPYKGIFGSSDKLAEGKIEDYEVRCDTRELGSTAVSQYARCQINLKKDLEDRAIVIYQAGFASKVLRAMGGQDVKVGNVDFDKKFIVSATEEALVAQVLSPTIQQLCLNKFAPHGYLWIEKNKVRFECSHNNMSSEEDYNALVCGLEICLSLAKALDKRA